MHRREEIQFEGLLSNSEEFKMWIQKGMCCANVREFMPLLCLFYLFLYLPVLPKVTPSFCHWTHNPNSYIIRDVECFLPPAPKFHRRTSRSVCSCSPGSPPFPVVTPPGPQVLQAPAVPASCSVLLPASLLPPPGRFCLVQVLSVLSRQKISPSPKNFS